MTSRHKIRLAGPWKAQILNSSSHANLINTTLKMRCIDDPSTVDRRQRFSGIISATRTFNLPTGLDEQSKVFLSLEGCKGNGPVVLNQHELSQPALDTDSVSSSVEYLVSSFLVGFNRLVVTLDCSSTDVFLSDAGTVECVMGVALEVE